MRYKEVDYDKSWNCTRGAKSDVERHNYKILNKKTLECVNCGKILVNEYLEHSRVQIKNSELYYFLQKASQNNLVFGKKPIIIYKINFSSLNSNFQCLDYPSKSYIGQTVDYTINNQKVQIKRMQRHINEAIPQYGGNSLDDIFHRVIRKYSNNNKENAQQIFRIHIWQICLNQVEADFAEEFWIGWFKTQFIEFGWNIEPGGLTSPTSTRKVDPVELDLAIKESLKIPILDSPVEYIAKKLNVEIHTIGRSIGYYYRDDDGKPLKYWDLRKQYLKPLMELYIRQGYSKREIGPKIGLSGDPQDAIQRYIREFYAEGESFTDIRRKFLIEVIQNLICFGYTKHKGIATHIPGLSARTVQDYVIKYLGGMTKAIIDCFDRPRAIIFIKMGLSRQEICEKLGYSKEFCKNNGNRKLSEIFWGWSIEHIKTYYKSKTL